MGKKNSCSVQTHSRGPNGSHSELKGDLSFTLLALFLAEPFFTEGSLPGNPVHKTDPDGVSVLENGASPRDSPPRHSPEVRGHLWQHPWETTQLFPHSRVCARRDPARKDELVMVPAGVGGTGFRLLTAG